MITTTLGTLTDAQKAHIDDLYGDMEMKDFFKLKVLPPPALPDQTPQPDLNTGLVIPDASIITVTNTTTFRDLYDAQYGVYDFPQRSLFEN